MRTAWVTEQLEYVCERGVTVSGVVSGAPDLAWPEETVMVGVLTSRMMPVVQARA